MSAGLLRSAKYYIQTSQSVKNIMVPRLVLGHIFASVRERRCAPLMISVFQVLGVNPMMTVMTPRSVGTSSQEGGRPVWGILWRSNLSHASLTRDVKGERMGKLFVKRIMERELVSTKRNVCPTASFNLAIVTQRASAR